MLVITILFISIYGNEIGISVQIMFSINSKNFMLKFVLLHDEKEDSEKLWQNVIQILFKANEMSKQQYLYDDRPIGKSKLHKRTALQLK